MIKLYRTGEKDTMGRDVYRRVGSWLSHHQKCNVKYILKGEYFVGDSEEMFTVCKPYKEDGSWCDGEPFDRLKEFEIWVNNPKMGWVPKGKFQNGYEYWVNTSKEVKK
jgi:hypothetical protein